MKGNILLPFFFFLTIFNKIFRKDLLPLQCKIDNCMSLSNEDIVGKEFLQNCGDSLLVLEKTNIKGSKEYLYRCIFKKYPYEGLYYKINILRGTVNNPQIEQVEFVEKIWPQNCGDSLKIIKKSDKKQGSHYLWECEFQKYPYKIFVLKQVILRGIAINPLIEENEFIGKIFPQNCGDDLKVIKKSNEKRNGHNLYECEFQKYPCKVLVLKNNILSGCVFNYEIINQEFIGQIFPQNCGDSLKVIQKTTQMKKREFLYECEFQKYPYKCLALKRYIEEGNVVNNNLPYCTKEGLIKYIQENFKDKKPTLAELSDSLGMALSTIGQRINEFKLRDYISYLMVGLENKIKDFCLSFNKDIIEHYYLNDSGVQKEIDIYFPNLNLGIEVNGNYWHSELYLKSNYHQEKSLIAQQNNINLVHIFEYEWLEKQEIIESLIKSKLGIFDICFGARNCKIKELDYKTYADFCNENHLQGECGAKVKLGLFYFNELIQVMSFGSPRFTDKYEWEIIRECSKLGHIVIGGKEKLWKYFIKNYNPSNCISYCDFSKFNGNSYLKLGFKKLGLNKPGFVWWNKKEDKYYWRNPYKHREFKNSGYLKIYDCGQLVFVWNK